MVQEIEHACFSKKFRFFRAIYRLYRMRRKGFITYILALSDEGRTLGLNQANLIFSFNKITKYNRSHCMVLKCILHL